MKGLTPGNSCSSTSTGGLVECPRQSTGDPISGKIIKLEGSFVTRKVYTVYSYNITRFVPTDACYQDCIRNDNIRVPGEMCEESLYHNYEEANQDWQINSVVLEIAYKILSIRSIRISDLYPSLLKHQNRPKKPAGFPNWGSGLMDRSSAPRRREVSPASVRSE